MLILKMKTNLYNIIILAPWQNTKQTSLQVGRLILEFSKTWRRNKQMKRYGNLYPQVYDMVNIRVAHENARRGKISLSRSEAS